ncbi:MAG TPA: hypothetical protein VJ785_03330 [Anaerolineales bacterium]|nr:hypothetical protein [Anaerolineales bacterium]
MQHTIIPPREPGHAPVRPPMVYIEKPLKWEYKQIVRNLESEKPLAETELNALGEDGWEMIGIAQHPPFAFFYFKRQVGK